ncbi:MAG: YgjV family protein [Clostridia bacterium]|nr:YgjV family protein [Clostridia bacterium]
MEIIIQSVGVLGIIASIISFQCKKHNSILFFRTLNEALFAIQFFLLGAYTGMAMNLVGCVRNVIFTKQISKNKKTTVSTIIFSILFITFGIVTWQGAKSILIMVAKVLSTVAYGNKNTTFVRTILFITCTNWLIYNAIVMSIAGVFCEAFTLSSLIIGVIRLDIIPLITKKQAQKKNA